MGVLRGQLPGLRGRQEEAYGRGRRTPAPPAIQAADALSGGQPGDLSPSVFLRRAVTCAGLALPLLAAMTLPTSELKAFPLPARYSATIAGFAARTLSTIFSIVDWSEICVNPRAAITVSASPSPAHIALKTSLAILLEIVPS